MDKMKQLQQALPETIQAVLVEDAAQRFYLTGMRSSAGIVLATRDQAWLIIDFRYFEEAEAKVSNCRVIEQKQLLPQVAELLAQAGVRSVSIDAARVSVERCRELREGLPGIRLDDSATLSRLLEALRGVKDAEEAEWHRQAQRITDETFTHICGFIRPGLTELDVTQEIGCTLTRLGSDDRTFQFIVASGPNGALPHGFATHRRLEKGDMITMDFGAVVHGRLADMTRTVALGHVSQEQRTIYDIVLEAQARAMREIRAGASCRAVDRAARGYIYEKGYEGCFSHGLGHSVGVEAHENPRFNEVTQSALRAGNVMTVEPGVYLKRRMGVRIEDMILITDDGFENFTKSEKKLLIL